MATEQPPRPGAVPKTRAIVGAGMSGAVVATLAASLALTGIRPDEGKRNTPYLDIAKVPTVCYGHTGSDVVLGSATRTDAQCSALLAKDVLVEQRAVAKCVPALASRPYQWAASTRLAHNIGISAFCHSGAAALFNRGDWANGCDQFLPWNKIRRDGQFVVVAGLSARRERERRQCRTDLAD